jgi:hypothetical protein
MLIRNNVVFVVRVYRLVLWWYVDLFGWQLEAGEVFEKIGVMRLMEVEEGE